MSDIVTRLWGNTGKYPGFENLNTEAAAEIERLRARVAELEAERDRWKAIAEKRHEILRNLEWSSYDHDDEDYGSYCPCCTSMDDEAHVAGWKMAEAIAESSRAASGGQCYPFSTQTCDNPGCTCRAEKRDVRAANERGEG